MNGDAAAPAHRAASRTAARRAPPSASDAGSSPAASADGRDPSLAASPGAFVALRRRWRTWWHARHPRTDALTLTQRNVYILPTRPGLLFAGTLIVLLIASINYQLALGYLLTFLLAGSALASMHLTHATLRGLTLHLRPLAPVHAGETARLTVVLASPDRARWGVGLAVADAAGDDAVAWGDVPAQGEAVLQAGHVPPRRGRHGLPALRLETRFPLGLFRAWTVWRPAAELLVYPAPERPAAPLPAPRPSTTGPISPRRVPEGAEFDGVRGWRRGDSLRDVVWKKAATALATGGELISRERAAGAASAPLVLDWRDAGGLDVEARLSRLAAWVLAADRAGWVYGLTLPGVTLAPDGGEGQRRTALEALALWR